jgi:DNA-binding NtrC family response regulator
MSEGTEGGVMRSQPIQEVPSLELVSGRHPIRKRRGVATGNRGENEHLFPSIIGSSPAMQVIFSIIEQVAPSRASVLVTGESGTGKELVAQAIHEHSPRANAPFVKLHCAALAETLLESELFGHEKGAYTGSVSRREGRFKQADRGTLFLDEIGDISATIQLKLLRFLQERTFERVGGNETLKVDVRIIAATSRNLTAEVAAGRFREDLLYRLNVVNVDMPPLRARPSDLQPLAKYFLQRFAKENGKSISGFDEEALLRIADYRWSGNVRELENVVERAVVLCNGSLITAKHLPINVGGAAKASIRIPGSTLDEIERHSILMTLEACGGSTAQAAHMLGVSVRKIQYKLHEYGISVQRTPAAVSDSDDWGVPARRQAALVRSLLDEMDRHEGSSNATAALRGQLRDEEARLSALLSPPVSVARPATESPAAPVQTPPLGDSLTPSKRFRPSPEDAVHDRGCCSGSSCGEPPCLP